MEQINEVSLTDHTWMLKPKLCGRGQNLLLFVLLHLLNMPQPKQCALEKAFSIQKSGCLVSNSHFVISVFQLWSCYYKEAVVWNKLRGCVGKTRAKMLGFIFDIPLAEHVQEL